MSIRVKRKQRITIIIIVAMLVVAGGFGVRIAYLSGAARDAQKSLTEGTKAYEAGEYTKAVRRYGRYVQYDPNNIEVLFLFADSRWRVALPENGHLTSAINSLRRVLDAQPDHTQAEKLLLQLYEASGQSTETEQLATKILQQNPDDLDALKAIVSALLQVRRMDEALPLAERYNELNPTDLEQQIRTFGLLINQDQPTDQIITRAEKLREAYPEDPKFDLLLAWVYAYCNDYNPEKAIELAREAAKQTPPDDETYVKQLVDLFDRSRLFKESQQVLEQVAQDDPQSPFYYELILRIWEHSQYKQVVERLSGLDASSDMTDVGLLALKSLSLQQLGQNDEAKQLANALASRNRDQKVAQAWASILLATQQDKDPSELTELIKTCLDALSKTPDNPYFLFLLGNAYAAINETELALGAWSDAIRHRSTWPAPRQRKARLLAATGRGELAAAEAYQASLLTPDNPDIITWILVHEANLDSNPPELRAQLLKLVTQVQEAKPGEPLTLPIYLKLLVQADKHGQATKVLNDLLAADTTLPQNVLLKLAQISITNQLGLQDALFDRIETTYGLTPSVAFAKAVSLAGSDQPEEGLQLLDAGASSDQTGSDPLVWKIQRARYLDYIQHPDANSAWVALGDNHPTHLYIQQQILQAKGLGDDRDFIDRTIDRVRAITGEFGLTWRMARAKWLLQSENVDANADVAKAISLLNNIVRDYPSLLQPHIMLAHSLQRVGNVTGAIERLDTAAEKGANPHAISLEKARLFQTQQHFEDARDALATIVSSDTATPDLLRRAAVLLAGQGEDRASIAVLEKIYANLEDPAPADLLLAKLYYRTGKLEEAEQICQRLMQQPTVEAIQFTAQLYASQGQNQDAQNALAKLDGLDIKPGVRELILANHHSRSGTVPIEQVLDQYRTATQAGPKNPDTWLQFILQCIRVGQIDEALSAVDEALGHLPDHPNLTHVKRSSQNIVEVGDQPLARPLIVAILTDLPNYNVADQTLAILADAKRNQTDLQNVLVQLRPLADLNIGFLPLQELTAEIYLSARQYSDAIDVATRSMQAFPTAVGPVKIAARASAMSDPPRWPEALDAAKQWRERTAGQDTNADLFIAQTYLGLGDALSAIRQIQPHIEQALLQPNDNGAIIIGYARALIANRRVDEAADMLEAFLPQSAIWRAAWINIANALVRDTSTAADWLNRVTPIIPNDANNEMIRLAQAWLNLASRANTSQHTQPARDILETLCQGPEAPAGAWFLLSVINEQAGDLQAAVHGYRQALAADSNMYLAMNNLAYILAKEESFDEAIELALSATQGLPQSPDCYDTLAYTQQTAGQFDQALQSINQAISLDPNNPQWQLAMVEILVQSGRTDDASQAIFPLTQISLPQPLRQKLEALQQSILDSSQVSTFP